MSNNASVKKLTDRQTAYRYADNIKRNSELQYLAGMLPEMRAMALSLEEKTLAYLLELASMEAELQMRMEEEQFELYDTDMRGRRD